VRAGDDREASLDGDGSNTRGVLRGSHADDAQARFASQTPFLTLEADTRYEQALEPGRYAVCDA
jgi:hypothetical protein